jgi:nucleotide-binding universal stress UspA family protein
MRRPDGRVLRRSGGVPITDRRFLVAYDGSEESYWALMQAARAAIETGAQVGVVTVSPGDAAPALTRAATAAASAAEILGENDIEAVVYTPTGNPAVEIARIAEEDDYEAIYIGRRGEGSLARDLFGSVSDGVLHASERTTVIAR